MKSVNKDQNIDQILRNVLLLSFLSSIILLGAILVPGIYYIQKKSALEEINQEAETQLKFIGTHIHNVYLRLLILGKNHFIVNSLVNSDFSVKNLDRLLKDETESFFIKKIMIVNSEEKLIYETTKGDSISKLGIYLGKTSLQGGTVFHQDITKKRIFISAPILYYNTPQGSLIFEMNFEKLLSQVNLKNNTGLELNLEGIRLVKSFDFQSYLRVDKIFNFSEISHSHLLLHIKKDRIFGPIYRFTSIYILIMLLFLIGSVTFSRRITKKILNPLIILKSIIEDNLNLDKLESPIHGETSELTLIRQAFFQQAMEMKGMNLDLENRVAKRTQDLEDLFKEHTFYKDAITKATIITESDLEGNIIDVNDNFCRMTKYSRDELTGTNIDIISSHYHSEEFWNDLWNHTSKGKVWRNEILNKDKEGNHFWVDTFVIPKMDENNEVVSLLSIQRDITQKKEIEEQIIKEKEKAESATQAKSQFLATMTHEIRTPMNAVLAMSDILLDSQNINEEERKYIKLINNSGKTLVQIINDILDYSKIESGGMTLEQEPFEIKYLAEEIIELFRPLAEKKGLALNILIEVKNNSRIGDTTRIKQVFFNLIGNALKFTTEGSITIHVTDDDQTIYVEVTDTGIGIPTDKQQQIFERFTQADTTITRKFGGTGLGLNISLSLIESMGGKIGLKSEVGIGSTFSFNLKLPKAIEEIGTQEVKPISIKDQLKQITGEILIVDDALVNIEVLQLFIKNSKIKTETAVNGELALKLIANHHYDLIFMDIEMPVMDGITAIKKIRVSEEHQPNKNTIVALSAHSDESIEKETLAAGFDYYLSKPIARQKFIKFLIEHLTNKDNKLKDAA